MDDRGRFAQPLTPPPAGSAAQMASRRTVSFRRAPERFGSHAVAKRFARALRRLSPILSIKLPRGAGLAATFVILVSSLAFGVVRGGHGEIVLAQLQDARDAAANAAGFRITSIALAGEKEVGRETILASAGVNGGVYGRPRP